MRLQQGSQHLCQADIRESLGGGAELSSPLHNNKASIHGISGDHLRSWASTPAASSHELCPSPPLKCIKTCLMERHCFSLLTLEPPWPLGTSKDYTGSHNSQSHPAKTMGILPGVQIGWVGNLDIYPHLVALPVLLPEWTPRKSP